MSLPYDYSIITHWVAVKCPDCADEAVFEFAECVKIKKKADIPYFKKSKYFEYQPSDNQYGEGYHLAYYYHGLHAQHGFPALKDLPSDYEMEDWAHPDHLYRNFHQNLGTLFCIKCALCRKHHLNWPNEAFFQILYKGENLWAFDRRCAGDLMQYISSKDRKRDRYKHHAFLLKLPSHFLTQKARETVVKKLKQKLEE